MFGALIGYSLIFVVGYLLLLQLKKTISGFEAIFLSFLLGTANAVFVLMIFGILGHLDLGIYVLAIETICLISLLYRSRSLSKLKPQKLFAKGNWTEAFFILLIAIGISLRFILIWTYVPSVAWDSLKFYLPWTKQLFEQNAIPNFDLTFNAGEPIGHSISFVIIGYMLYFLNGGVNEMLVYTISPVFALMTTLMIYLLVCKVFGSTKLAYIATAIFAFIPLNVFVGTLPYVDAMLAFCTLAFFLYLDSSSLAAVAASLAVLTKYSGFVLPLLAIGYLLWKRNLKSLLNCVLILALFTAPWYARNIVLYHNPLPFQALPVKVFEHPPEGFDILMRYGAQMQLFNPINSFMNFFTMNDIISTVSRLVVLSYALYAIMRRRQTSLYMISFLTFVLVMVVSSEHDSRYIVPFYPLALIAFTDIMKTSFEKIREAWPRLLVNITIVFLAVTMLNGSVTSYVFDTYVHFGLVILGLAVMLLMWRFRHGIWRIKINMKYAVACGLVGLTLFSLITESYSPMHEVEQQKPDWQSGVINLVKYIESIPDNRRQRFLTIEDPGIRYYADIESYELTDPYGSIKLSDLYDSPRVQGVFFGDDSRRFATQSVLNKESNYTNMNNIEAMINSITVRFVDLTPGTYFLVVKYKGEGYMGNSYPLVNSSDVWKSFDQQLEIDSAVFELTFARSSWLMLRFVLLIPSQAFYHGYDDWLRNALKNLNIKYVVLSETLSNVWVYTYYSIFAFTHMPESSTVFEVSYSSDYWVLYKVKDLQGSE
jgi:4-amino-4-deoxy-L-arabinose transferase-like glycosyltransferase